MTKVHLGSNSAASHQDTAARRGTKKWNHPLDFTPPVTIDLPEICVGGHSNLTQPSFSSHSEMLAMDFVFLFHNYILDSMAS